MRSRFEKRTIIFASVFLFISLGIVGGVIVPTLLQIKKSEAEAQELHDYLEKRNEHSISLRQSLKRIKEIQTILPDLDSRIFTTGDELKLITSLEEIAAQNNVRQTVVSSNLDKITNNHVAVSLSIAGSYQNALQYLADIEKSQYYIAIDNLQMSAAIRRSESEPASDQVSLDLDVSLYAVR